jgi:23S rRNA (cytosine1962-C5)-methyltransferase
LLKQYASNRKVLNTFCYTGGFSVYALAGGAQKVVSVDSSAAALELTDANVLLNFPDSGRHSSVKADVTEWLKSIAPDFDLIILDPPAFAKHIDARHRAVQAYKRLNLTAMKKIAKGGILFTFSCSQVVDRELFRHTITSAAIESGRQIRILHQLTQGPDHPVNIFHPEGEYLKGLVLQVD